jgi:hypothetical protein
MRGRGLSRFTVKYRVSGFKSMAGVDGKLSILDNGI